MSQKILMKNQVVDLLMNENLKIDVVIHRTFHDLSIGENRDSVCLSVSQAFTTSLFIATVKLKKNPIRLNLR